MAKEKATPQLSRQAQVLWGKTGTEDSDLWLSLIVHLTDVAVIAKILWDEWVPLGTKKIIAEGIIGIPSDYSLEEKIELAGWLLVLLALQHDIGKATPAFQAAFKSRFRDSNGGKLAGFVESVGLKLPDTLSNPSAIHHSLASYGILRRHGWDASYAVVVGAHHGSPPSKTDVEKVSNAWMDNTGFKDTAWVAVQDELVAWSESFVPSDILAIMRKATLSRQAQVLLSGLLIMADWIASDEQRFPLTRIGERAEPSEKRAREAWNNLDLAPYQELTAIQQLENLDAVYKLRFSIETPRPVQSAIPELLAGIANPGIMVIEAPMGEGKTEAALAAAEMLAEKTGRSGIFFALPTQATSDGIFPRILSWMKTLGGSRSIKLAHGKAQFNKDFQGLGFSATNVDEGEDDVFVSEWAHGRKRALLNDFVVGTIDQVLMAGLKQKHLMLRHLGLANKVVIIDECHAYDTYMNQYLYKTLNWLGSYQVPVVVLSATLPIDRRQALVEAYLNSKPQMVVEDPLFDLPKDIDNSPTWENTTAYPLITYTAGKEVSIATPLASARKLTVKIEQLGEQDIVSRLARLLDGGGCVGIIVNTVARAQDLTRELIEAFGEDAVMLLHSRFTAPDRISREEKVRGYLGPHSGNRPERLIVVGTQVLEQSLDIDFDIMVTDICPMDLLIQRIGRLHRHGGRTRPLLLQEPKCFVTGIEGGGEFHRGSKLVYGAYLLMNTQALLPEQIILPDDISRLVQSAYDSHGVAVSPELQNQYDEAKEKHDGKATEAAVKARTFQISNPEGSSFGLLSTIVDWLNTDISDKDPNGKRAEATVRDSMDSVQVLVVQRKRNGAFYLLPWGEAEFAGHRLPEDFSYDNKLAQAVARNTVTLPVNMTTPWKIDKVITAFEKDCCEKLPPKWQDSPWLRGELFLILNEEFEAELCGFKLYYDARYGLCVESVRKDGDV